MVDITLEYCPFCGAKAELHIGTIEASDSSHDHTIRCSNWRCNTRMDASLSFASLTYETELQNFINRWNTRV